MRQAVDENRLLYLFILRTTPLHKSVMLFIKTFLDITVFELVVSCFLGSLPHTIIWIYIGVTLKDLGSYMNNQTEFTLEETLLTTFIVVIIVVGITVLTRKSKR